jgi:hypothetical protein
MAFEHVANFSAWLNATEAAQAEIAAHETPVLTRAAIEAKLTPMRTYITALAKRPRPIPKVVPLSKNSTNSSANSSAFNASSPSNSTANATKNETAPDAAAEDSDADAETTAEGGEAEEGNDEIESEL